MPPPPPSRNRVKEIRKNSEIKNWFYCNTKNNPADILTRSKGFEKFQENSFWWTGPRFLKDEIVVFTKSEGLNYQDDTHDYEIRTPVVLTKIDDPSPDMQEIIDIQLYSSLLKVVRITAWFAGLLKI